MREHSQISKVTLDILFLNKLFINTALAQGGRIVTQVREHTNLILDHKGRQLHTQILLICKVARKTNISRDHSFPYRSQHYPQTAKEPVGSSRASHTKCQHPTAPPPLRLILKESLPWKRDSGMKELALNIACSANVGTDTHVCLPSQERL